eukprot:GHRR01014057.1.p1 GENE.GHRR01014057.1~~GHRR01014057.1.p1  ORF type:complete len:149 (+),score=48.25 GHRR01014057.1:270-716(+)
MAPKKEGGGGRKAKGPAYDISDEALSPFGVKANEIVRTPLGLQVTVIGVKYESQLMKEGGQVWVRYSNGHEAPLEGRSNAAALGYRRCTEADHIRRDVLTQETELQKLEEKRRVVQEVIQLKAQGLPIPDHLMPAAPEKKPKANKEAR